MQAMDVGARERTMANLALTDVCVQPALGAYTITDVHKLPAILEAGEAENQAVVHALTKLAVLHLPGCELLGQVLAAVVVAIVLRRGRGADLDLRRGHKGWSRSPCGNAATIPQIVIPAKSGTQEKQDAP